MSKLYNILNSIITRTKKTETDVSLLETAVAEIPTTADESLELMTELEVVDPTTDENGNVFTDENGAIYTL